MANLRCCRLINAVTRHLLSAASPICTVAFWNALCNHQAPPSMWELKRSADIDRGRTKERVPAYQVGSDALPHAAPFPMLCVSATTNTRDHGVRISTAIRVRVGQHRVDKGIHARWAFSTCTRVQHEGAIRCEHIGCYSHTFSPSILSVIIVVKLQEWYIYFVQCQSKKKQPVPLC